MRRSGLFPYMIVMALLAVMFWGLAACTSTPAPVPVTSTVAPGIAFLSSSMEELNQAGVNVDIYARTMYQVNENYSPSNNLIYYYDVTPPTEQSQPAVTGAGTYTEIPPTQDIPATWKNIPPGMHTFSVQLVNSDYTPLYPPVIAQVTMMVPVEILPQVPAIQSMGVESSPPVPPSLYQVPPTETTPSLSYEVIVSGSVYNFGLNDDLVGKTNVPGDGHFIYYIDVDPPTNPAQPAVTAPGTCVITTDFSSTWTQVSAGMHTFSLQLVNNDNTPLSPPVLMRVAMTMPPESYP